MTVRGNQVVLTGTRRNEEKLEIGPGRSQTTNAFQTFLETFPMNWPVEAKLLSKSFEGDQLTVIIPKKAIDFEYRSPVKKSTAARARVERPKFPDNLPIAQAEARRGSSDEPVVTVPPSRPTKGSGTLT